MTENTFADHAEQEEAEIDITVDENGKIKVGDRTFDSQADLIKSWANGQKHISTLESERAVDKEALTKAATLEQVLERFQPKQEEQQEQTAIVEQTESKGNLTVEEVNKLLEQRDTEKVESANVEKAMTIARQNLGSDFIAKLEAKAIELGMSEVDALTLAKKSPSAFTKLFTPESVKSGSSSFGDINAASIRPHEQAAASARVEIGAKGSDVVRAWNAAKPTFIE